MQALEQMDDHNNSKNKQSAPTTGLRQQPQRSGTGKAPSPGNPSFGPQQLLPSSHATQQDEEDLNYCNYTQASNRTKENRQRGFQDEFSPSITTNTRNTDVLSGTCMQESASPQKVEHKQYPLTTTGGIPSSRPMKILHMKKNPQSQYELEIKMNKIHLLETANKALREQLKAVASTNDCIDIDGRMKVAALEADLSLLRKQLAEAEKKLTGCNRSSLNR